MRARLGHIRDIWRRLAKFPGIYRWALRRLAATHRAKPEVRVPANSIVVETLARRGMTEAGTSMPLAVIRRS
jgi:hypothetical protein